MKVQILKLFLIFIFISFYISGFSQDTFRKALTRASVIDSLKRSGVVLGNTPKKPEILLSTDQALKYLQQRLHPQLWNNSNDPLRQAFSRLVYEASHSKFDSLKTALMEYPYDSLSISWDKFYVWEPLKIKIPVISKPEIDLIPDSTSGIRSVENLVSTDSLNPRSLNVNKATGFMKPVVELKDTTIMVIVDTLDQVTPSRSGFPFKYYNNPYQADSIQAAVKSLLNLIDNRDSSLVTITGIGKAATPMMLNSKTGRVMRFWLKNEFSDSVAVWLANPYKNTIGLYLEQGINFRRPGRQGNYANPKINLPSIDNKKLQDLRNATIKQPFWKYRTETSFVLNQASLSNWVKGGEGSIATALDVTGYADFNNTSLKLSSNNFARLKFGYIATDKEGIKKNLDLLETNMKLNHIAFGKVYFSAILLFKTQIARGFNYFKTISGADTSSLVSKFMNPGILTVGLGLDYKPNKTTSINFSPLSYKGTFVTDTAHIDQTQYGIAKNKKSLNEPGVSFMISNEFKVKKAVTIINRLQLFTNYIHNPQNVDVDWEMIATAHINWFTDVRFNTHLIFDDDTRTVEKYKNGQSVLLPDGTEKKTARIQFKELLGFAVSFKF
jgi:hypothetical protein